MLRESNNVIAEDLARQVALHTGKPASFSGAAAAVTAVLGGLGAGRGIHLVDGSGLSPQDQVTPAALAAVVRLAAVGGPGALRAAVTGMPVAGFSGTLAPGQSVFGGFGPAALGMVRAKTGNLTKVASLAGIIDDASGQLLAFAFMADQIPKGSQLPAAAGGIDAMATTLAGLRLPLTAGLGGAAEATVLSPGVGPGSYRGVVSSGQMIDWDVAISTGVRWVRPGPQVSLAEARGVVAELHELAATVIEPVRQVTGMSSAEDSGQMAVVDRPGWIRANIDGFRVVLDPLVEHLRGAGRAPAPGSVVAIVGSRITGVQAGLILAYLAGRVLGQYELFLPPDPAAPRGRRARRAADPGRAEHRHGRARTRRRTRTTSGAGCACTRRPTAPSSPPVDWLRGYVQEQMTDFLLASELDPATILNRLRSRRGRGRRGGARQRSRRQPHRGDPDPAAAGDPRPADLRDDAGRGARRLRHGRRRPAGGAHGRRRSGPGSTPAGREPAGSSRRSAGSWAST